MKAVIPSAKCQQACFRRRVHRLDLSGPSVAARHQGFALVIVLWVLAGLIVVAVAVASSARVNGESVKLLRDRVRAEAAFLSASARVAVVAATGSALTNSVSGPRGSIYVDGRLTQVDKEVWVRLQDVRGLVDLGNGATPSISRLLARCGAGEKAIPSLTDALGDYVDADQLKRLNGAEAFDYRMSGDLPEPRNSKLLSREELWRIKGWPDIKAAWKAAGCDDLVTVHGDGLSNRNTAPLAVLVADGVDETIAKGLLETRKDLPVGGASAATVELNPAVDLSGLGGGFVGKTLRIRLDAESLEWGFEYELELTPDRTGGPWRMHEIRYPQQVPSKAPRSATAQMPAGDFRPAVQDRNSTNAQPRLPFGN